jgi:hypothetical protein
MTMTAMELAEVIRLRLIALGFVAKPAKNPVDCK